MVDGQLVYGEVALGFEKVKEEFKRNFVEREELGAACTIYYKGEKVVDLWGGLREEKEKWKENTKVLIFSATKGIAAIVFAKLHSDGLIDYEEKIATYWPEFSQKGKGNITVRQLLSHQSGLVLLEEKLSISELDNFNKTAEIIAKAEPMWEPGKFQGYQATTIGFFMGELVKRVDRKGRSLGQYFKEEIAEPLQLDFHIGLPDDVADDEISQIKMVNPLLALVNIRKMPPGIRKVMLNVTSPFVKSMTLVKGYDPNKRETWKVEQPSGNGIGTARAVGYLYSVLANGGKELNLVPSTIEAIAGPHEQPSEGYLDRVMNIETRYGLGFMKPDPTFQFSKNPKAFGFLGATGSFAFSDPNKVVGYAYFTRKMGYYGVNDPRERTIRETMYECIEKIERKSIKTICKES
ncbi:serine hydrolase [Evansella sp. AB-P1]|uniref:serine hydrolase domain-containing protein n=1 Tax=Evansella sp. AB-P1 TaxID=3037653 RepID=UPI00241C597D|nr:serine hydrolase domain-containing protein [Evansella sp. AB-P1]MDG5788837.1 serine hydrolase [Evansella sp. AB-P1]